jgi:CheY-like chemotaxis protein
LRGSKGHQAPEFLIVDDHPSFHATAGALLEAEGLEVVAQLTARNGSGPAVVLTSAASCSR